MNDESDKKENDEVTCATGEKDEGDIIAIENVKSLHIVTHGHI